MLSSSPQSSCRLVRLNPSFSLPSVLFLNLCSVCCNWISDFVWMPLWILKFCSGQPLTGRTRNHPHIILVFLEILHYAVAQCTDATTTAAAATTMILILITVQSSCVLASPLNLEVPQRLIMFLNIFPDSVVLFLRWGGGVSAQVESSSLTLVVWCTMFPDDSGGLLLTQRNKADGCNYLPKKKKKYKWRNPFRDATELREQPLDARVLSLARTQEIWERVCMCMFGRCPVCLLVFFQGGEQVLQTWDQHTSAPGGISTQSAEWKAADWDGGRGEGRARLSFHDHHYYHYDYCGREAALKASVNFSSWWNEQTWTVNSFVVVCFVLFFPLPCGFVPNGQLGCSDSASGFPPVQPQTRETFSIRGDVQMIIQITHVETGNDF